MAALGLCLYFNQLFYMIGIDLSGVVVATCMQPTIPVFTAMIAVLLHMEAGSAQKFAGIGLAVGGSICMVRWPCPLQESIHPSPLRRYLGYCWPAVGSALHSAGVGLAVGSLFRMATLIPLPQ